MGVVHVTTDPGAGPRGFNCAEAGRIGRVMVYNRQRLVPPLHRLRDDGPRGPLCGDERRGRLPQDHRRRGLPDRSLLLPEEFEDGRSAGFEVDYVGGHLSLHERSACWTGTGSRPWPTPAWTPVTATSSRASASTSTANAWAGQVRRGCCLRAARTASCLATVRSSVRPTLAASPRSRRGDAHPARGDPALVAPPELRPGASRRRLR